MLNAGDPKTRAAKSARAPRGITSARASGLEVIPVPVNLVRETAVEVPKARTPISGGPLARWNRTYTKSRGFKGNIKLGLSEPNPPKALGFSFCRGSPCSNQEPCPPKGSSSDPVDS